MRTIYIDSDFKCHAENAESLSAVETDAFDGKCDSYIEGYRFVPHGKTYIREDGREFEGEMAAPFVDHSVLIAYQKQYESDMQALNTAYQEGVNSIYD